MSPDERQVMGPAINGLRDRVTEAITARKAELREAAIDARLATETVDVTCRCAPPPAETGRIHPITQVTDETDRDFRRYGLSRSPKVRISRPTITTSPR
jgi:phenylalanyl-tRNA synthetase alpha chain